MAEDKQWASRYLLDPLTAPEPSQETGPGTHYNSTFSSPNPYRNSAASTPSSKPSSARRRSPAKAPTVNVVETPKSRRSFHPSPPSSASPRRAQFDDPLISSSRNSFSQASTQIPTSTSGRTSSSSSWRPRNNSLPTRYAGDISHRPLDIITRENKIAYRSPHLRKKHIPGADSIDTLDTTTFAYHHEGPYDATLLSRNTNHTYSPVAAVQRTNEEALKATPPEKLLDSLKEHRPLDGVAIVPPGMQDMNGRTYNYEEGTNLMIENGGNYKRWPGLKYLPEDIKGKGEPSYSLEKALKEHKISKHRRVMSDGNEAIEMTSPISPRIPQASIPPYRDSTDRDRRRSSDSGSEPRNPDQNYADWESDLHRRISGSKISGSMRKRFGSLRGRKVGENHHP